MERVKQSRRKSPRQEVENYYKILGTRANATQTTIKKKYIESVKTFPPETHPEEFQRIRRAYETLHDPARRSEYDMFRKYGGKLEKLMNEAHRYKELEQWDKAIDLLNKARKITPNNVQICIMLAYALFFQGDAELSREHFRIAYNLAVADDEKILVLTLQARILLETDRAEEALDVLEYARSTYPQHSNLLQSAYLSAYRELGRNEELWAMTQNTLPSPESQSPDDIFLYVNWINTMIDLDKWNVWSTVQSRMRKFLKTIKDNEDKLMVTSVLLSEYKEYCEVARFREAMIFIDMVNYILPKEPYVKKLRQETQELMRIEKELGRMSHDMDVFPVISMYVHEWHCEEFLPPEEIAMYSERRKEFIKGELAEMDYLMDTFITDGIRTVKRKYPGIYKRFQRQLDELLHEHQAKLPKKTGHLW